MCDNKTMQGQEAPASVCKRIVIPRPALRYYGGKWLLAPWIISFFPEHDCYVEPFGGAASVLLQKPPSFIEVYNDLNGDVVNFFKMLRERRQELIEVINLTPFSRLEYAESQKPCDDPLEAARRFFVWSWQGRGRGGVKEPGGWRFMSRRTRGQTPADDFENVEHLLMIATRLKKVQIENDDAITVLKRFDDPNTLFYVDPPYVQDTRSQRWRNGGYAFEYSEDEHIKLAEHLHDLSGMIILSGYQSSLYDNLFPDWLRVERNTKKDSGADAVECLWISPNCKKTMPLFTQAV